jgi:hypothetical protein
MVGNFSMRMKNESLKGHFNRLDLDVAFRILEDFPLPLPSADDMKSIIFSGLGKDGLKSGYIKREVSKDYQVPDINTHCVINIGSRYFLVKFVSIKEKQ